MAVHDDVQASSQSKPGDSVPAPDWNRTGPERQAALAAGPDRAGGLRHLWTMHSLHRRRLPMHPSEPHPSAS
jgi:hypothetical protein